MESGLHQVSWRIMMSVFFVLFLNSGVLLLHPNMDELIPWMFHSVIDSAFMRRKSIRQN